VCRYFYLYQVLSRWEEYLSKVGGYSPEGRLPKEPVKDLFPFHVFFANAPQPLFKVLVSSSFNIKNNIFNFRDFWLCAKTAWKLP
jgi:hypothetical protein